MEGIGLYLTSTMVSWASFNETGIYYAHHFEIPYTDLHTEDGINAALGCLAKELKQETPEERMLICVSMPYMSIADKCRIQQAVQKQFSFISKSLNVRVYSCASSAAVSKLACDRGPGENHKLIITNYHHEYEAGICNSGDGVIEMIYTCRMKAPDDREITKDQMREFLYRVIDESKIRNITRLYLSVNIPEEIREWISSFFQLTCEILETEAPLYGVTILSAVATGRIKNILLLDCIDYAVHCENETVIEQGTTIPTTSMEKEIIYNSSRPDQCIYFYFVYNRKDETPYKLGISVADIVERHSGTVKLKVYISVNNLGDFSFNIQNTLNQKQKEIGWSVIQNSLRPGNKS